MGMAYWTFGVCFNEVKTCHEERYDGRNITQISGFQLATMHPGSFDLAVLESLEFPRVKSMNCAELCKCLSCGYGHCSDKKDQDKWPKNEPGFICRCSNSPSYPNFNTILRVMMTTAIACRKCDVLVNVLDNLI